MSSFAGSNTRTYQPSRLLISAYGSAIRVENSSSFSA